jgi:Cd2+/Zn2+-exporting ATPase
VQGRAFKVLGLDCAEEVAILKREVGPLVGGEGRLAFDVLNGRMTVDEAAGVSDDAVIRAVAGTGMTAEVWDPERSGRGEERQRRRQVLLTTLSGSCVAAGFGLHGTPRAGSGPT